MGNARSGNDTEAPIATVSKETASANPQRFGSDWLFVGAYCAAIVVVLGCGVFAFQRYGGAFVDGLDEQIGELVAKQGRLAAEAGQTEEALRLFEEALAAPFLLPEQRLFAIQDYANLLIDNARYDEALAWIEQGAEAYENEPKLAYLRFRALRESNRTKEALAAADAWYRVGETTNDVETMRAAKFGEATVLRDAGRTEPALTAFAAAHELRPGGDTALRSARLCMQLGRKAEARRWLEYAADAPDADPNAVRALLKQLDG